MRRRINVRAAAVFMAVPAAVAAQDDAVVVSATRAPQPSLEVPASVDRLYGDEIREGRPQVNLSESLGRVPGIVVQNRQNYAQDLQISSRGFGARAAFGVRGIRLIVDGIPATMPDGQGQAATIALGSAQRIEVLRGPFSSLYGNAAGGVITVETENGPETPAGEVDLLAGSYGTKRGALKAGGQWGPFNALADLSRFETGGYRQHSAARREHLNAKARYAFDDNSSLTLVANTLHQRDTQDPLGLTRAQVDQDPRQATAGAFTFNTRKTVLQDQAGATLNQRFGNNRLQVSVYSGQRYVEQYLAIPLAAQAAVTHSGGVVNLDRGYGGGALRLSSETRFLAKPFRLSLGIEHERMQERRRGFINNNGIAGALKRDEDDTVSARGAYAQGEWKFAECWAAHAGMRYSRVHFDSADHFIVPGKGNDSGERTYRATTPVAGLVFRLDRNTSIYGNLGRGFETPTLAELAHRNVGSGLNLGLEASSSRHAEVGVKTVLARSVRLNAALFDIVTRNEIVVDRSSGGRTTFKNAGHTDRKGLEIGAEWLAAAAIEARVAYTYLSARFREGFDTVAGIPAMPVTIAAGNRLPGIPQHQLYAELRYRLEDFYAQIEALYRSSAAVNDQNSQFAGAYTTMSLVAGLAQQTGDWRISEFIRFDNLADRAYVGSVIVNEANGRFYEPSPRRNISFGLQARLQF